MDETAILNEAEAVARNLAAMWSGGAGVLKYVADASGDPTNSPWSAIHRLGPSGLEAAFSAPEPRMRLTDAFQRLTRYLTSETWFDRASRDDSRLAALRSAPVAYFCAEFGLADWFPVYSGGLGVLAGDVLKESSDMGLPFVGVGLFYRNGFFQQRLDSDGYQSEFYRRLDPADFPLFPVLDEHGVDLLVPVPIADRTVFTRLWRMQVGRTPLYLLDTDVSQNERQEDRAITSNLYGGDEDTRIRQEIVLGIGGVRALKALGIAPSIYSMNEGHAAFLAIELLADAVVESDGSTALEKNRNRIMYTNHTVVPAGNDIFPRALVSSYLGPYVERRRIGIDRLLEMAATADHEHFSMAVLAFQTSGKANAVSTLHAAVIPREWPGFTAQAVTNGVHIPTWLGAEMEALLDTHVPDRHEDRPSWDRIHGIPDADVWEARSRQRRTLIEFVNDAQTDVRLDPEALTLVWARRFAEYKRPALLASDLSRLTRLVANSSRPVQLIISGKAHPRDESAKWLMHDLIARVRGEAGLSSRVAVIPDYSLRVAAQLTAGADVWINTPRKPLEASGTSGMKSGDNGGLQLTVLDGWAAEVDWWGKGWGIEGRDDTADAEQLYSYLEESVVPTFYNRNSQGVSSEWVSMIKSSMIITLDRYSSRRMLLDYLYKLYLPLLEEQGMREESLPEPTDHEGETLTEQEAV